MKGPLTRGSTVLVALLAVATLTACAKRPATTAAVAPAPTGAVSRAPEPGPSGVRPPVGERPGGQPGAPATPPAVTPGAQPPPPARVPPGEFRPIEELKDVRFDFDKYDIRPGDAKILDGNARWMKANPNYLILIEGHADERGTNEYNLALGERRAKSVMNYLVAQGVMAVRMTIISYGEERPVCTEKNEPCWARNRRAHFLVKPQ